MRVKTYIYFPWLLSVFTEYFHSGTVIKSINVTNATKTKDILKQGQNLSHKTGGDGLGSKIRQQMNVLFFYYGEKK